LSANAWGLKGKLPGCKHSWIASFDGAKWKTYEITDLETVDIQQGTVLYAGYTDKMLKQLIVSNRHPGTKWFGNMPKLDYIGKFIDVDATDYPMNYAINLTTNLANFGGSIEAIGNIISYVYDMRLKTKTSDIKEPLEILNKLTGFYYTLNDVVKSYVFKNFKCWYRKRAKNLLNTKSHGSCFGLKDRETLF
jgi:hypothetical protein